MLCILRTPCSKQGQQFIVRGARSRTLCTAARFHGLCLPVKQRGIPLRKSGHNARQYTTRALPSDVIHPTVLPLTTSLSEKQPAFSVSAESISVLNDPIEFYELLLAMIKRAKERIFISSLYIGSKEEELVSALHEALSNNPSLELYLTLDFNRSTRPGSSPTSSTAHLLVPLLREFPDRVHVSMFRSPHLKGLLAKVVPPRFNEGWGTWHAKVYGVDGEVMISGANLNESYFTNRQDRYIHFASQPTLAQYCFDFLRTVSTFSYQLLPPPSPVSSVIASAHSPSSSKVQTIEPNEYTIQRDGYTLHWPDASVHPHHIQQKAEQALSEFQAKQRESHSIAVSSTSRTSATKDRNNDVLLFPVIQAGQFNIREEESAFQAIFSSPASSTSSAPHPPAPPLIDLTSGYFSLYQPYQTHVLSSSAWTRIVVAAPEANGFYGSKGISGRIPDGYTIKEKAFVEGVKKEGKWWGPSASPPESEKASAGDEDGDGSGGKVKLEEWSKPGWTYHAKGIWVSPSADENPVATLFGSTNLNARSAHIDTELSFVMVLPVPQPQEGVAGTEKEVNKEETPVENLRIKLREEVERIRENVSEWEGGKRKVGFVTTIIAWIVEGML